MAENETLLGRIPLILGLVVNSHLPLLCALSPSEDVAFTGKKKTVYYYWVINDFYGDTRLRLLVGFVC
jgi:hypothetical protein